MRQCRRGIALLLVLGTLAIAATTAAGLARAASAARLHSSISAQDRGADRLLRAAEVPILDWLHRHAGRIVLPIEAQSPRWLVLEDTFELGDEWCGVTIVAFDQCGMLSLLDSPRYGFLPVHIYAAMEEADAAWRSSPGLDVLASAASEQVFPGTGAPLAAGELLATHNPPERRGSPVLNINTAPMPLLEAVFAARGLGLDALIEARAAGRVAAPGALARVGGDSGNAPPLPVTMSTCWSFRIDCRVGSLRRSWWCVYADTGSNWERVQRLAIDG